MTASQPIGAHVSASGGIWTAVERAIAIEADGVQLTFDGQVRWFCSTDCEDLFVSRPGDFDR